MSVVSQQQNQQQNPQMAQFTQQQAHAVQQATTAAQILSSLKHQNQSPSEQTIPATNNWLSQVLESATNANAVNNMAARSTPRSEKSHPKQIAQLAKTTDDNEIKSDGSIDVLTIKQEVHQVSVTSNFIPKVETKKRNVLFLCHGDLKIDEIGPWKENVRISKTFMSTFERKKKLTG